MKLTTDHLNYTLPRERWKERLRELIIYICRQCADHEYFGAIKLNKILYYSDFESYKRLDFPITGTAYRKLPKGPAPENFLAVRRELVENGLAELDERPASKGDYVEHRLVAKREADLTIFSKSEIEVVDEIINRFADLTASEVSELSHDIRWHTVEMNTLMPYEMVWMSNEPITSHDRKRVKELILEHGW